MADLTSPYCISTCIPLKCTQGARSYLAWQERHTWSPPPGSIIQWEKTPLSTHFVRRLAHWHLLPITLNKPLSITAATRRCYRREFRRWRCCRVVEEASHSHTVPLIIIAPESCVFITHYFQSYRVSFLTGAPLKVLSVRLHSKSHQKSSKCQNLLTGWHLEFLGGGS